MSGAAVEMRSYGEGIVDVVVAPPVAVFSASIVHEAKPHSAISLEGDLIRVGDLLGKQAWYRIVEYVGHWDLYIAELVQVLPAVVD